MGFPEQDFRALLYVGAAAIFLWGQEEGQYFSPPAFIAGDKGFAKAQADLANLLAEVCRRHDNYLPVLEGLSQTRGDWFILQSRVRQEVMGESLLKRDLT